MSRSPSGRIAPVHPKCRPVGGQPQEKVMSGQIDWYYHRKG